jgi:dihydrofolate reductase
LKIVVNNYVTLDGVIQSPGHADEDRRGGFEHGGWAAPYNDEVMLDAAKQGMEKSGSLLFGRYTYEKMRAAWADQPDDNPFANVLNNREKYVASRTLKEPLDWRNSTLLEGDAADAVAELKKQPGKDVVILGSGDLIASLMQRDLIDEYVLLIHPVVVGGGRRLFPEDASLRALRLTNCVVTTTGVIIATYTASGEEDA